MSRAQNKISITKKIIALVSIVLLVCITLVGVSFASTDSFVITGAEISAKSPTAQVNNLSYEKCTVKSNVTFHEVGDSITYQIKVKNNDKTKYTIKSVSDDNENKHISYEYGNYEGMTINPKEEITIEITERYTEEMLEMENRAQKFSANLNFEMEDEDGNVIKRNISIGSYPKTGDDIGLYIATLVAELTVLAVLSKNNTLRIGVGKSRRYKAKHSEKHRRNHFKFFSIIIMGILVIPTISKAATNIFLVMSIENNIALKDKLLVSYKIGDKNYEIITPYNGKIERLDDPEKDGYIFDGWKNDDGTDFDFNNPITDDIKIKAKFIPIDYTITYDLNGGALTEGKTNPTEYTADTEDIALNKPVRDGYVFTGWTGTELADKTENVTIVKGSIGNREYKANWEIAEYTISYNLKGGTATGNETAYTIKSEDITINNPTRAYYTFEGWTGTGLTDKTKDVVIAKGSTGDREYTAHWTPVDYSITYAGLTADEESALNNPTTYNIETENVTLNNPQDRRDNDGDIIEKFVGWKDGDTTSTTVVIPILGDIADKQFEAVWTTVDANKYTVTYDLGDGELSTPNPVEFTKFDTFTLNNPTKEGYTFDGWTGSNGNTPQITVTIPAGVRENLNYKANWTAVNYTITTKFEDESIIEEIPYTIESNDITIENPSKLGYTFSGWTGTNLPVNTIELIITHGSIGNKEYTAHFDVNNYEIVFDRNLGSGSMPNEEMTYDVEKALTNNTFTRNGYTFSGWNTMADGSGTSYSNGESVKNLAKENGVEYTLYAQWTANIYTVVFDKNNATATGTMESQTFNYDESKKLAANSFTKLNYTFAKWNTEPDGSGEVYEDEEIVSNLATSGEITLYAQWEGNSYAVTFEKNHENVTGTMEQQDFVYGTEQRLTANTFSLNKFNFVNWNTDASGNGDEYSDEQSVLNIGDTTLYAQWNYTIAYNSNNGTGTMEDQVLLSSEQKQLTDNKFERNNYAFKGWNTKSDGTGTAFTNKQLVSDLGDTTLYAQWTYTKNHNTDGTKVKGVGNFKSVVGSSKFSSITAFLRSDTLPDASVQTYEIADVGSVTGWYDGTVFYWYSESECPLLDENLGKFFEGCSQLTDVSGLEDFDSSNVKYLQNFFRNTKVNSISALAKWDTSKLERIDYAFCNTKISSIEELASWNVSKVTTLEQTFNASPITDITPLRKWDVSSVTTFSGMFSGADLRSLDGLEKWDVSKVKSMEQAFYNNKNLTNIDAVENWNVSSLQNGRGVFKASSKIESLEPVRKWNVSSITNMNEMFAGLNTITNVDALAKWNVSSVQNFSKVFDACRKITDLEGLKDWNVSNGTTFEGMFYNCTALTAEGSEKINNWQLSKTANFTNMFRFVNNKPTFLFDVEGTPTPGTWDSNGTLIVP